MSPKIGFLMVLLLLALAPVLGAGCGSSCCAVPSTGRVSVTLVNDGPALGFEEVNLNMLGVDIKPPGGEWIALPLAAPGQGIELMRLQEHPPVLAQADEVPVGVYHQLRFRLAPGHSVQPQGGGPRRELAAPEAFEAMGLSVKVAGGADLDLVYKLATAHSIQETASGLRFLPLPRRRAWVNRGFTTAIRGRVTQAASGEPMAGITVMAQLAEPIQRQDQRLFRTTTTRADGTYLLDLLPCDSFFWVVVPPQAGPRAHRLQVSRTIASPPGAGQTATVDLALKPLRELLGWVEVPRVPARRAANPYQEVTLIETLPAKGDKRKSWVILDARPGAAGTRTIQEVPPGIHVLRFDKASWVEANGGFAWLGQTYILAVTVAPGGKGVLGTHPLNLPFR